MLLNAHKRISQDTPSHWDLLHSMYHLVYHLCRRSTFFPLFETPTTIETTAPTANRTTNTTTDTFLHSIQCSSEILSLVLPWYKPVPHFSRTQLHNSNQQNHQDRAQGYTATHPISFYLPRSSHYSSTSRCLHEQCTLEPLARAQDFFNRCERPIPNRRLRKPFAQIYTVHGIQLAMISALTSFLGAFVSPYPFGAMRLILCD